MSILYARECTSDSACAGPLSNSKFSPLAMQRAPRRRDGYWEDNPNGDAVQREARPGGRRALQPAARRAARRRAARQHTRAEPPAA